MCIYASMKCVVIGLDTRQRPVDTLNKFTCCLLKTHEHTPLKMEPQWKIV